MMTKEEIIKTSLDYIAGISSDLVTNTPHEKGDHSGYFTREEQFDQLLFCFKRLQQGLALKDGESLDI